MIGVDGAAVSIDLQTVSLSKTPLQFSHKFDSWSII